MYNRQDVKDWIEEQHSAAAASANVRGRAQWGSDEPVPATPDRISTTGKKRWGDEQPAPQRKKSRRAY